MECYVLYGQSGTGKSSVALQVAAQNQIEAIIDDGLLIYHGKKVAGLSAKYESTKIQAVKRAIFHDCEHARAVKEAIEEYGISRILILATSRKMADRIVTALELPAITKYISIAEIKSSAEMKAALYNRRMHGQHVIPIPRIQVEHNFLRRIWHSVTDYFWPATDTEKRTTPNKMERTIVVPRFYHGEILVHEKALRKMIVYSCSDLSPAVTFIKTKVHLEGEPYAEIDLSVQVEPGEDLRLLARKVQQRVYKTFSRDLNIELSTIDLSIRKISFIPLSSS